MPRSNPLKNKTGLRRLINAYRYSCEGLYAAFTNEAAFRQELLLSLILIPCAFWFADSGIARALMIGSIFLVLIVELINSALEAVVDRISDEIHPLSKRAKDLGSAAVLLALLNALIIWICVLL